MENEFKAKKLTDSALITGIMVMFAFIGNFVFPFLDIIYPLPAILLAKRQNWKYAALAVFSSGIIIFIMFGVQTGIYYTLSYGPIAVVMGYFISKNQKKYYSVLFGALAYLLSMILMIYIIQIITGINTVDYTKQILKESFELQEKIISNFGQPDQIMTNSPVLYEQIIQSMIALLPSVLIMSSLMVSFFNYQLASKIGKRLKISIQPLGKFRYFMLPSNIILGVSIFMAGVLLLRNTEYINNEILQTNIIFLFNMIFLLQGAAVLSFLFDKYNFKRIFRILISLAIFFNPMLMLLLWVAGIVDSFVDIRKIRTDSREIK